VVLHLQRCLQGQGTACTHRKHPGALRELSTQAPHRGSRRQVSPGAVPHWGTSSPQPAPRVTAVPEHGHRGHQLPEPVATCTPAAGEAEEQQSPLRPSRLALRCIPPLPKASSPFRSEGRQPPAARAPKPQETSNKRLFKLDVKA